MIKFDMLFVSSKTVLNHNTNIVSNYQDYTNCVASLQGKQYVVIGMITQEHCPPCNATKKFLSTKYNEEHTNLSYTIQKLEDKHKIKIIFVFINVDENYNLWIHVVPDNVRSTPYFFAKNVKQNLLFSKAMSINNLDILEQLLANILIKI